jgi:hypothetical protein
MEGKGKKLEDKINCVITDAVDRRRGKKIMEVCL